MVCEVRRLLQEQNDTRGYHQAIHCIHQGSGGEQGKYSCLLVSLIIDQYFFSQYQKLLEESKEQKQEEEQEPSSDISSDEDEDSYPLFLLL